MTKDIRIVIAQRGWVFVGEFERQGHHVVLHKGAVVRRWGTDKGLGQLAEGGPTPDTVLDPFVRPVELLELTVVANHTCNPDVWSFE